MTLLLPPFRLLAGLSLLLCLPAGVATAQTAERRTSLGLVGSGLQYEGDFGSDYWQQDATRPAVGLAINQYLSRGLDLNSQAFYGRLEGSHGTDTRFVTTLVNLNLGFKVKLNNGWALKENAFFQPYLLAASGWTYASRSSQFMGRRTDVDKGYVDVFTAAGISFRLGGGTSLFVQTGQHLPLNANLDGTQEPKTPRWADRFLQHSVGLNFNMGQANDADEDGVTDRLDKCPNTAQGIAVSLQGCPLDGDADGVPDHLDTCPTEAGTAELLGCPDKDSDGITDAEDTCPEVAGKAELRGCPDTDSDGIVDQEDKCPGTAAGTPVDFTGCPVKAEAPADTTATPAALAASAPLDNDGDGVPDAQDRCPGSPGPASRRGCPVIKDETRQTLQDATRAISFEPNKDTLLPASYPTLAALLPILTAYPDHSLSIAGHTDSRGPVAFNLALSRERAEAARRYLLSKGVAESRLQLRGYGATHPLVSNAAEAGRARNRRVEFDLFITKDRNAAEVKYGPEPTAASLKAAMNKKKAPVRKAAVRKRPALKAAPKAAAPAAKPGAAPQQRATAAPVKKPSRR
ncbi:OmpA family protein [Hymenobacter algoricola]|uniref:OmpA-like domain-containing protein n=1 Tax=Hymenobacter algoricola TaxID=486267 RepID=A0ABP7N6K8_9BACT